jgi:hypothetical protein
VDSLDIVDDEIILVVVEDQTMFADFCKDNTAVMQLCVGSLAGNPGSK